MKDLEREFERMVRENRGTIYTVCYMFSNDQDEVADLFQEVLINLWKSLPSFEECGNVRSWIYRVSLNVCILLDRKKRRKKMVPLTMDIDPYEEVESNQNSRQMDMLRRRIAKLGQYDRAIILLWLENMSYEEIAAVMGITVKNVSDNGGLKIAYRAYKNRMASEPLGNVDGFTPDQRFYLAYARVWACNSTPEYTAMLVNSDVHSPARLRVMAALPMIDTWYEAFGIKPTDKMFIPKEKRALVW